MPSGFKYAISKRRVPVEQLHPGLDFFEFRDPDGNTLKVIARDQRFEVDSRPILNRIDGIFVHVASVLRAARWYHELLSLPKPDMTEQSFMRAIPLVEYQPWFSLQMHDSSKIAPKMMQARVSFDSTDIDATYQFMANRGDQITSEIQCFPDVSFFTLTDPDGNALMICQ